MPIRSRERAVLMVIRYNGDLHHCLGTLADGVAPREVRIEPDQFPAGFEDEYNAKHIVIANVDAYLVRADAPDHAWFCQDQLDLIPREDG